MSHCCERKGEPQLRGFFQDKGTCESLSDFMNAVRRPVPRPSRIMMRQESSIRNRARK